MTVGLADIVHVLTMIMINIGTTNVQMAQVPLPEESQQLKRKFHSIHEHMKAKMTVELATESSL